MEEKNLERKENIFKKAGKKFSQGCEWLYEKRHWFFGIGLGIFAIYAKGHWDGERFVNEYREKDEKDRMDFMKALVGDKTGLTEEQIDEAQSIKNMVTNLELDPYKLQEIYETWSQDDWDEFIAQRYGGV